MQFWEDASPLVKGTVVVGSLLAIYLVVASLVGLFPYASHPEASTSRTSAR